MSQEHEALVTQTDKGPIVADPKKCPIAKIQETSSLLSGEIDSISTPSPVHGKGSIYYGSPGRTGLPNYPKKNSLATSMKSDVDDISVWSDTLSISMTNPNQIGDYGTDEKKSLLDAKEAESRIRHPSIASAAGSVSPRPSSRSSRHSRQSRRSMRHKSSPKEGSTRGEILLEVVKQSNARERTKSTSSYRDSIREKNSKSKKRKDSGTTTSSSAGSMDGEVTGGFPGKGKRGYMTAKEAVELGDRVCGLILKDKLIYFWKPLLFVVFGSLMIAGGLVLTVFHFMFENSLVQKNAPYFTYSTITLSTGVILFMVGLVWFPIKQQKWKDGTASPMLLALAKWQEQQNTSELAPIGLFVSAMPALVAGHMTAIAGKKQESNEDDAVKRENVENKV